MEKLFKKIINCETGEETVLEYTKEEYMEHEKMIKEMEVLVSARKNLETKRASALAKLAALGLTEDEIAAL